MYSVSLILNNDTDIVKQTSDQNAVTSEKRLLRKEQQLKESEQN